LGLEALGKASENQKRVLSPWLKGLVLRLVIKGVLEEGPFLWWVGKMVKLDFLIPGLNYGLFLSRF